MRSKLVTGLAVVALMALAAVPSASAGENVFFSKGEAETFNLSDLYDGESRTFGEGEDQVTAVREGDVVRLTGMRKNRVPEISCNVTTDSCKVISVDGGAKTMIVVGKKQVCEDGEDCELHEMHNVMIGHGMHGEGHNTFTHEIDCDGDEDCKTIELHNIMVGHPGHGEAGALTWTQDIECEGDAECDEVTVIIDGDIDMNAHGDMMRVMLHEAKPTLRCPEGDTTMHVEPEEVDAVFLCPKHSLPLEKVKFEGRKLRRVELKGEPTEH